MANHRQQAHQLVDQLEAGQLAAIVHLLQVMTSPFLRSLSLADVETDDLTPETAAAIERSRSSLAKGEGISHDEIRREFGLEK
ncbi:MAG: hypothetical protein JOZ10_07595 [Acidobacteria bacterium]|nr:hypothetical protein [Acidobacteriota bacterium]